MRLLLGEAVERALVVSCITHRRSATGGWCFLERPQAPPRLRSDRRILRRFTARTLSTPRERRASLIFYQAQRGTSSLWLGCWGGEDSGFEQKLAYLLPYKIADPGGG